MFIYKDSRGGFDFSGIYLCLSAGVGGLSVAVAAVVRVDLV
jgi:hypothetical protein